MGQNGIESDKMIKTILLISCLFLSAGAEAETTRYRFGGTINDVRDFIDTGVESYIPFGTAFTGTFDYDPDSPFGIMVTPTRANYATPLTPVSTTIGAYTFNRGTNSLQIDNGNPGLFFLSSNQSDFSGLPASMGGYTIVTRIQLYGEIANFTLPRTLDLTNFPGFIGITGYSTAGATPSNFAWHVAGNVSSLEAMTGVPEPSMWAMMVAGFGLMGAALRRPKRAVRMQKLRDTGTGALPALAP